MSSDYKGDCLSIVYTQDKMITSNKWLLHYSLIVRTMFCSVTRDTSIMCCVYRYNEKSLLPCRKYLLCNFARGAFWNFSSLCSTLFRSCDFSATALLCVNRHCEHLWLWNWMLSTNLANESRHSFETLTPCDVLSKRNHFWFYNSASTLG